MAKSKSTGRGRLSSIDQLPDACTPIIAWASEELRRRDRTQTEIYEEFYQKLDAIRAEHRGELEFSIPSFSSFNRYSIRLATLARRLDDTREIAATLAKSFDAGASDDLTVMAAEAIKTLVFELLTDAGESGLHPKEAMQIANALRAATQAQGVSTARRQNVEKEFKDGVEKAVEKVRQVKGLTAETANAIKAEILGVDA
ncbi:MAG: DUF3486 family protein [Pseudomonadota bacterium]